MIDFVDRYYYRTSYGAMDSADREQAQLSAFSTVLPLIIDNKLSEKQSICFKYKYISGKSQNEIANILKISQPTVSRHINAAKDIINDSLKYCVIALKKGLDEYEKISCDM